MVKTVAQLEYDRLSLQAELDQQKSSADRNKLGQFATPTDLAQDILSYGVSLLPPDEKIQFLDPAIGTGAFYSALCSVSPNGRVTHATGFEIDPHYGLPASRLWSDAPLDYTLADFTQQPPTPRFNLIICNPPYVRHHHLSSENKLRLQALASQSAGVKLSGLAGLYCHFLAIAHRWMADGAIAGWLVPSEFMDVNYGAALKKYLTDKVTLLHIHRFDPNNVQFADALVSSAVVWFQKTAPPPNHKAMFTFGGSLARPEISRNIDIETLCREAKWTRFPLKNAREPDGLPKVGDLFQVKRGIATGGNSFFILRESDAQTKNIPRHCLRPILPSPRYVNSEVIDANEMGDPILDRQLFLLDARLKESEIKCAYPSLWTYLEQGRAQGVAEGYICRHRTRWYTQDQRPPAPIVCTYLGRSRQDGGRPFRFIRNHSQATITNVYLAMYPKPILERQTADAPDLLDRIWRMLNEIDTTSLLGEGRVYGGGLHKLEPRELANVPLPDLATVFPQTVLIPSHQPTLFETADSR